MEEYYKLRYGRLWSQGPGLGEFENRRVEIEKPVHISIIPEQAIRFLVDEVNRTNMAAAAEEERWLEKEIERENARAELLRQKDNLRQLQMTKKHHEDQARQCAAAIMELQQVMDVQPGQDPGGPEKTGQP